MLKQKKTPQISFPGIVMVIIIAVLLIKSVALPAFEISQAELKSGSGDFDGTLELFEEYISFGQNGEARICDFLVKKGDYHFRKEDYDSAISAYEQAEERGLDLSEKIYAAYIADAEVWAAEKNYNSAVIALNNAELAGLDVSEKKKEVYYQWAEYAYDLQEYEEVIRCLKKCEGYPGAEELMQEMQRIYAEYESQGISGLYKTISLAWNFGNPEGHEGIWSIAQEKLGAYKDWLSVNGSRFIAIKGDGTAFVYGAGAEQLNVSGWNDLKGVYCYGSGAFGWSNSGTVFASGMYSVENLGFSDIVQIVGNENRVFGLKSDGTVLCFRNGQGTYTMDIVNTTAADVNVVNVRRLAMSADGRIAMLKDDGTVCYETEAGVYDISNTGVSDVVFSGNELVMLYTDGTVSAEGTHSEIAEGDSLLLYPSQEFVLAITDLQYAVGEYRKHEGLWLGDEFTTDEPCLCIGNGDYWDLETGCIVYLTQSGDINVFYRYDHLLEVKEETIFITNIFQ